MENYFTIRQTDLEKIISTSITYGHQMAMDALIPEKKDIRLKDALIFLKLKGYKKADLEKWIRLGWLRAKTYGERSASTYSRKQLVECVLKESASKLILR